MLKLILCTYALWFGRLLSLILGLPVYKYTGSGRPYIVILLQRIVSSTIEKMHSDSTFIAGTANMAFENLDTQLKKEISINVFSPYQTNTQYTVLLRVSSSGIAEMAAFVVWCTDLIQICSIYYNLHKDSCQPSCWMPDDSKTAKSNSSSSSSSVYSILWP